MDIRTEGFFDAVLYFDANLPKLKRCKENCESREGILCVHRFNSRVCVEYYNAKRFNKTKKGAKWTDFKVITHIISDILAKIAEDTISPTHCAFIILTRDRNFIEDVKIGWQESKGGRYLDLEFSGNSIVFGDIIIFVQQIDCPGYGHSRSDSLRCAFEKVNDFLKFPRA